MGALSGKGARIVSEQDKKSDAIAETLTTMIVRGDIAPGEKLRQDEFAREFGVSQGTIREALMRVASQGLAISIPRRGMCVATMDQGALEELKIMRSALEPVALWHSVPNLSADQIAEIERIHEMCNAADTVEAWEEANRAFHMAVIAGCNMPRLSDEVDTLQLLYAWHFNNRFTARWKKRDDPEHAAILGAIKVRDADRAASIMKRHLARLA